MRRAYATAFAALQIASGALLAGYALIATAFSGWGGQCGDITYGIQVAPVPWFALLAAPWFVAGWRRGGPSRRLVKALLALCVVAGAVTVAVRLGEYGVSGFPSLPLSYRILAVLFTISWPLAMHLALSAPLLAARTAAWPAKILAVATLALGGFLGTYEGDKHGALFLEHQDCIHLPLVGTLLIASCFIWMGLRTWSVFTAEDRATR